MAGYILACCICFSGRIYTGLQCLYYSFLTRSGHFLSNFKVRIMISTMSRCFLVCMVLFGLGSQHCGSLFCNAEGKFTRTPVRTTLFGDVQGVLHNLPFLNKQVERYLGIPYAHPPVGQLRFEVSQSSSRRKFFLSVFHVTFNMHIVMVVDTLTNYLNTEQCILWYTRVKAVKISQSGIKSFLFPCTGFQVPFQLLKYFIPVLM